MKLEIFILGITLFFIANTYLDGNLINKLKSYQKYYKIALFAFIGLCVYLFLKKSPHNCKDLLMNAAKSDNLERVRPFPGAVQFLTFRPTTYCTPHHRTPSPSRSCMEVAHPAGCMRLRVVLVSKWRCGAAHALRAPSWRPPPNHRWSTVAPSCTTRVRGRPGGWHSQSAERASRSSCHEPDVMRIRRLTIAYSLL